MKRKAPITNQNGNQVRRKAVVNLRQTFLNLGRSFSNSAEKLADICVDDSVTENRHKGIRIRNEIVSLFSNMNTYIKHHIKASGYKRIVYDQKGKE